MTSNATHDNTPATEYLLTTGEVAALLRVDAKTVGRWVLDGKITSIRTPGGQHRFRQSDVRAILNGGQS